MTTRNDTTTSNQTPRSTAMLESCLHRARDNRAAYLKACLTRAIQNVAKTITVLPEFPPRKTV